MQATMHFDLGDDLNLGKMYTEKLKAWHFL